MDSAQVAGELYRELFMVHRIFLPRGPMVTGPWLQSGTVLVLEIVDRATRISVRRHQRDSGMSSAAAAALMSCLSSGRNDIVICRSLRGPGGGGLSAMPLPLVPN